MSDIGGISMKIVIDVLIGKQTDPEELLLLVHKRTRNKHGDVTIQASLTGILSKADHMMFNLSREESQMYERQIEEC